MNHYPEGQLVTCSGAFTDADEEAYDPDAVYFKFKNPSGNLIDYQYDVDDELVKDSTGNYHVDVDGDEAGHWRYRYYSTGAGQAAADGEFYIDKATI